MYVESVGSYFLGNKVEISIKTTVYAAIDKVWEAWTTPDHIVEWNFASLDWQCPKAEINLAVGGRFSYRMEAKDHSMGFDFEGTFTSITPRREIRYSLDDNRYVIVQFTELEAGTEVVERFEAENQMSGEQQRQGWQAILSNFKQYVESGNA